jgi:hypothetical protein
MRQFLGGILLLLCVSLAHGQHYSYSMGGSSTTDTLVASTADTTGIFNLYASDNTPRPGDPCFIIALTDIGTNTTHDSLEVDLWVTDTPNLAKDGDGWTYVTEYRCYLLSDYDKDSVMTNNDDILIIADTLEYIPLRYARLILDFYGGGAADSTSYIVTFVGDKSRRND